MWTPDWLLKLIGKQVANKLELQEDKNMESKPWYKSQTIWTAVIAGVLGIYGAVSTIHPLPPIPEWVYTLLGAVGLHGLRTAATKVG